MTAPRLLVFGAIALGASMSASYAGPCSDEISEMQARIDAKTLVTTPNSDVIYAMNYIDVGRDGSWQPPKIVKAD